MGSLGRLIRSWIINENNYNPHVSLNDDIDWLRAMPFILINLSCLLVFYVRFSWIAVNTALFLYFFRLFTIGAFYHRYFSHKAFKTNRFGSLYLQPLPVHQLSEDHCGGPHIIVNIIWCLIDPKMFIRQFNMDSGGVTRDGFLPKNITTIILSG